MGYTNDFFNGFIKWGVLLPDLRFFGDAGMEKSTGRDVDLYFLGGMLYKGTLNSSRDLNDKQVGFYICNSASGGIPANAPDDLNTSFIYIGFGEGTTWGAQISVS